MKKLNIIYWSSTGLFSAFMLSTSIPDIMSVPDAKLFMNDHLGYPVYIIPFIGVAKLLGAIAILIPGYHRIKEWAYAGFAFDLIGAVYSQIAVGDPAGNWGFMFIFIFMGAVSYFYYHRRNEYALHELRITN